MPWKDQLQNASFRGVSFKVEDESAEVGRRVEAHEYPNRDKPYTEDLGKVSFRSTITAYVIGEDCFEQRDRLIEALNKPGPGILIHPTYGEMSVCVDDEIRVNTSNRDGRMVWFDLRFVEAGELSYPIAGAATAETLVSSCSSLEDCISDAFDQFGMDGMADFMQNGVINSATEMIGYVSEKMVMVDSAVADAARLLQGDISVLFPPPSFGKGFVEQLQTMWRAGKRLSGNSRDLYTMLKTLSGFTLDNNLAPRGVWRTDSATTRSVTQQRNYVASAVRTTALSEAVYAIVTLPAPTTRGNNSQKETGWPSITKPALSNAKPPQPPTSDLPTWDELVDVRDTLNDALDWEMSRATNDALFLALRRVKSDMNTDVTRRLAQTERTVTRTPDYVAPALVLAATWYDNAARETDITRRNGIIHPGFVPVIALRVPAR